MKDEPTGEELDAAITEELARCPRVRRSWRERIFTRPWRPWQTHRTVTTTALWGLLLRRNYVPMLQSLWKNEADTLADMLGDGEKSRIETELGLKPLAGGPEYIPPPLLEPGIFRTQQDHPYEEGTMSEARTMLDEGEGIEVQAGNAVVRITNVQSTMQVDVLQGAARYADTITIQ